MVIRVFLCFFLLHEITVSANPIYELPTQQCSCLQNGYNYHTNLPVVVPNSFQPYTQTFMNQNTAPTCQTTQASFNNQINQLLMDALMANPIWQGILSPYTYNYSPNGFENLLVNFPNFNRPSSQPSVVNNYIILPPECKQVNGTNQTAKQRNIQSENGNIEHTANSRHKNKQLYGLKDSNVQLKTKEVKLIESKKGTNDQPKPKAKKRRGSRKRPIGLNETNDEHNENTENVPKTTIEKPEAKFQESICILSNSCELDKITSVELNTEAAIDITNTTTDVPKNTVSDFNEDQNINIYTQSTPKKRRKKVTVKLGESVPTRPSVIVHAEEKSTSKVCTDKPWQNTEQYCQTSSDPIKIIQDIVEKSAFPQNPPQKEDKIAKQKKTQDHEGTKRSEAKSVDGMNGNVPKDFNSIMSYMNDYYNNQHFGNYDFFKDFPYNYEQFYQQTTNTDSSRRKKTGSRKRKTHRRTQSTRIKQPYSTDSGDEDTASQITEDYNKISDTEVTTAFPSNDELYEKTQQNMHQVTTDTINRLLDIPMELPQKIDLYNEDPLKIVTDYEDNISIDEITDYYPDFTDSAVFLASNKHLVRNSPDDRYYYLKKDAEEELSTKERKYEGIYTVNPSIFSDRETYVHTHNVSENKDLTYYMDTYEITTSKSFNENPSLKIESSTENKMQFRTPPALEFPDFETKQVNRDFTRDEHEPIYRYDDYGEKSSSYSNVKTPMYNIISKPTKQKQKTDIETVFAHSKVVKYGHVPLSGQEITTSNKEDKITERIAPTGTSAIVFAESLDYPEYKNTE